MVTIDEKRTELESLVNFAVFDLEDIVADQVASYPFEDSTAWDALSTDEKLAEYSRKIQAEGIIGIRKKSLADFEVGVQEFYVNRQATFDAIEADRKALMDIVAAEWQDKENYRKANADDLECTNYVVGWDE